MKDKLKSRIRRLIPKVYNNIIKSDQAAVEYDELTKFPELKKIIVDLLTDDFDSFLSSIDWVAPRPTTFRVNLRNDQEFYLIYNGISWIAQVQGKKYYLLNLPEEQRAANSIARLLRLGSPEPEEGEEEFENQDFGGQEFGGNEDFEAEEPEDDLE